MNGYMTLDDWEEEQEYYDDEPTRIKNDRLAEEVD